jgi:hypothetical protein
LCVQVRGEGDVGVGASVDEAIVVIIQGDHDPLGSSELLFQVTGDGLLLLLIEGGGVLIRPFLIQGLTCGSHGGEESLLLSVQGSGGGLSHGHGVLLLPLRRRPVAHQLRGWRCYPAWSARRWWLGVVMGGDEP